MWGIRSLPSFSPIRINQLSMAATVEMIKRKSAPRSAFTFTRETSYVSRYLIYARKLYVGAHDKVIPQSEHPPEVTAVCTEVLSINESLLFSSSVYVGLLFH